MSAVALLVLVLSAAAYSSLDCDCPEDRHSRKAYVAACIADCLDLDFEATEKNCSYNSNTGKVIVKYENFQEDGCPKCFLDWKNSQVYKAAAGFATLVYRTICGKKIVFGNVALSADYDMGAMLCGIVWPSERHWLPKDWDEVRCIIESLPQDLQRLAKLRLVAYRSSCSQEFFFCTTDTPRSLRKSFLSEELDNQTLDTNDATCALFDFKIKNKKAVDVRLRATDCKEKAFIICELDE